MSRKFEANADPVDLTKVYKVIMQGCGHLEERRMLPSTARKPWSPFMVIKSRKGAKCKVCRSGGTVAVWVSKSRNEAPPEKQKPTLMQEGAEVSSGSSRLRAHGWREEMPDPECWNFSHEDYPGVVVSWVFYDTGWSVRGDDYRNTTLQGFDRWNGEFHPSKMPSKALRPFLSF